jgi:hypothetical protein
MNNSSLEELAHRLEKCPNAEISASDEAVLHEMRATARKYGRLPIPKGVYRYQSHEAADRWLERMTGQR